MPTRNRSRVNWDSLTERIRRRDWTQARLRLGKETRSPCVAAFLDPSGSVSCSGRMTNEHVTPEYGRMGVRAADHEREIVTLCEAHHLTFFAGFNWALANKALTRQYLKELYAATD